MYEIIRIINSLMSGTKTRPSDGELEILQILWEHGSSSVRFVNEELNREREVGYTSTLKIMQIMTDKGLVTRNTDQRTHIYSASVEEKDIQKSMLNRFLKTTFRGSALNLVMQTLGNHQASSQELERIRKYIEEIEEQNPDS